MKTVAIIDYGMGNLHSARKAVEHVAPDCTVLVTDDAAKIREADRVILPGVGAIRDCMAEMHRCLFRDGGNRGISFVGFPICFDQNCSKSTNF